jgi:hypothetical protein
MFRSVIALICLLFFYPDVNSQSQLLYYKLKKGQTLRYEHVFEKTDTLTDVLPRENNRVVRNKKVKFLDFKVLGITSKGYKMSMQIVSSYNKTEYLQGYGGRPVRYETAFDSTGYSLVNFADQGREFVFEMDSRGKVLHIDGMEDFQNEVIQNIQSLGRQSLKTKIRYEYVLSRISEMYYLNLINDVFPDLSGLGDNQPGTRFELEISDHSIEILNSWNSPNSVQGRNRYNQEFSVTYDGKTQKWESDYGELFWDYEKSMPDSSISKKIGFQDMISVLWDLNNIYIGQFDIERLKPGPKGKTLSRYIGGYSGKERNTWIFGDIRGCDSCKAIVRFPGDGLVENESVYDINNQGEKLTITGDMPDGPGLVTIYFPKDLETFWSYKSDPRQIRLFVMPGDTIRFSVDLRKFGWNMVFEGKSWREQELLNSYVLGVSNMNMKINLQEIQFARKKFEEEKTIYSEEFRKWFDFEVSYEELEYRLNDMLTSSYYDPEYNPKDSLSVFFNFCNNYSGINSDAYKRFITRLVSVFAAVNGLPVYGNSYTIDLLETAGAILNGWDRYYVMARLTQARMQIFYTENTERYYKYFISEYKGSEFGNLLEEQWNRYSHLLPGSRIDRFDFTDYEGRKYNIRDFAGKLVVVAPSYHMPKEIRRDLPSLTDEQIKRLIGQQYKDVKTLSYYIGDEPVNKDSIREHKLETQIYVTDKKSVKMIREYFADRPDLIFTIDKDQRIATIRQRKAGGFPPMILNSWPQLEFEIDPPETVNRKLLWFTLIGLAFISGLLIIAMRIRNRYRLARQEIKRKMAELELDAVKSRMNPHFLFNSLSSIQNLVNGNEIEKANLYLAEFGELVRMILEQSSRDSISLAEEIETIRTYLELEKLRFPFNYKIDITDNIEEDKIEIPPLFIQPHIENAIIHALSQKGDGGELDIAFFLQGNDLIVHVDDNGPGLDKSTGSNGLGQGWKLTIQRVELLKNQWGEGISVEMKKRQGNPGMRVTFVIPLNKPLK